MASDERTSGVVSACSSRTSGVVSACSTDYVVVVSALLFSSWPGTLNCAPNVAIGDPSSLPETTAKRTVMPRTCLRKRERPMAAQWEYRVTLVTALLDAVNEHLGEMTAEGSWLAQRLLDSDAFTGLSVRAVLEEASELTSTGQNCTSQRSVARLGAKFTVTLTEVPTVIDQDWTSGSCSTILLRASRSFSNHFFSFSARPLSRLVGGAGRAGRAVELDCEQVLVRLADPC